MFKNVWLQSGNQAYIFKMSKYCHPIYTARDQKVEDRRKAEWSSVQAEEEEDVFYQAIEEDVIRKLRMVIALLPEQRQTILRLSIDGLSIQEIASQLGISANTV